MSTRFDAYDESIPYRSSEFVGKYIEANRGNPRKFFIGFRCNINQSEEEREQSRPELCFLFNAKRAICELVKSLGNAVVVGTATVPTVAAVSLGFLELGA